MGGSIRSGKDSARTHLRMFCRNPTSKTPILSSRASSIESILSIVILCRANAGEWCSAPDLRKIFITCVSSPCSCQSSKTSIVEWKECSGSKPEAKNWLAWWFAANRLATLTWQRNHLYEQMFAKRAVFFNITEYWCPQRIFNIVKQIPNSKHGLQRKISFSSEHFSLLFRQLLYRSISCRLQLICKVNHEVSATFVSAVTLALS